MSDEPKLEVGVFVTDYGVILLNIYSCVKASSDFTLLLTPDTAEKLADELGEAIEKARKVLIEQAS